MVLTLRAKKGVHSQVPVPYEGVGKGQEGEPGSEAHENTLRLPEHDQSPQAE